MRHIRYYLRSMMTNQNEETATLAGGCFWCLEAVFADLRGVARVGAGACGGVRGGEGGTEARGRRRWPGDVSGVWKRSSRICAASRAWCPATAAGTSRIRL